MERPLCPRCKAGLYSHSETVWCMSCGWARNRPEPIRLNPALIDFGESFNRAAVDFLNRLGAEMRR